MSKNENGAKTLSQKCQTMTYVTVRIGDHGLELILSVEFRELMSMQPLKI